MHRIRGACALAFLAGIVTIGACVAPARTFEAYEAKAADAAGAVVSAVETARVAAAAAARGQAFAPFLSVLLGEAASDASGARGLFESIQPPDARSDALLAELDMLLDRAEDDLLRLRTASRRGEIDALPRLARSLAGVSRALEGFVKAHS
jgi:hypothetical protein